MHVIFDRLCHFSSANIKLIAGLHFGGQLTQHKEAAEAMAMTGLRADRNLAAAAELMIMDVVHTFVVSKNNDKHVADGALAWRQKKTGGGWYMLSTPVASPDAAWSHCCLQQQQR